MEVAQSQQAELIFAEEMITKTYSTSLLGAYQKKNIVGVVAVVKTLSDFRVEEEDITAGLAKVVENTGLLGSGNY